MKKIIFLSLFILLPPLLLAQARKELSKIRDVISVLDRFAQDPEEGIPAVFFEQAEAIAIFPKVIKGGLIIGGERGKGVVLIREGNDWSNPAFMILTAGSIGFQIGGQSADIVLVFRDKETVFNMGKSEFTLGANASVAAGPLGRNIGAKTEFESEIYVYARSRGLYAGISLEGAVIKSDEKANKNFYEKALRMEEVFEAKNLKVPYEVKSLQKNLKIAGGK